jgi:hypothetical protein
MKKSSFMVMFIIGLFLVAGAAVVQAADKVDLTGTWNLDVKLDSGDTGSPIFTLKQNGDKLTGTYKGYFGEAPVTGSVKGNEFEMKYTLGGVTVVYKGKSDGNKMSGTIDYQGQGGGKFTGKKEKKS